MVFLRVIASNAGRLPSWNQAGALSKDFQRVQWKFILRGVI